MSQEKTGGHWLTIFICAAIVLAVVFALVAPHSAMKCEVGGEVFLNLLKMLVVPLVMSSVMSGILGLGDVRKLGKPGAAAVTYYISTTILAVAVYCVRSTKPPAICVWPRQIVLSGRREPCVSFRFTRQQVLLQDQACPRRE